jgi:riboflavin kinase / FMN adenylyltransferase
MEIYNNISQIKSAVKGAVVSIGNFDGVHKGHAEVIRRTINLASSKGLAHCIITFEPHPSSLVHDDRERFRLTSERVKIARLKQLGVEHLLIINFTPEFAKLKPEEFAEFILHKGLEVNTVVVGEDFYFGYMGAGNTATLQTYGGRFGFKVNVVGKVGEFSSSNARRASEAGNIKKANFILGYNFTLEGKVIHGFGRGKLLGFPTVNIDTGEYKLPLTGVYAVRGKIIGGIGRMDGVANIGTRPTFGENQTLLEAHFFDFNDDLYGQDLEIELLDFIRPEQKFTAPSELVRQIMYDIDKAKEILLHNL